MKTTDEYKTSMSDAMAFKHENPNEKATTAARIHHVNDNTIRSNLYRERIRSGKEVSGAKSLGGIIQAAVQYSKA